MTAKRFKALPNDRGAWDIFDYEESEKINGFVVYNDLGSIDFSAAPQLVDLLNELHEQVQAQATVIKEYQNRNEILNQQIYDKNKILLTEIEIGEKLHDENNRIKQTIQDMMETERTELGKSVLKQLYEAIQ